MGNNTIYRRWSEEEKESRVRIHPMITEEERTKLLEIGKGSLSNGIRVLIQQADLVKVLYGDSELTGEEITFIQQLLKIKDEWELLWTLLKRLDRRIRHQLTEDAIPLPQRRSEAHKPGLLDSPPPGLMRHPDRQQSGSLKTSRRRATSLSDMVDPSEYTTPRKSPRR